MTIFKPGLLILFGFTLFLIALAYDMTYAGLPFQDPSPEVYANWKYHSEIAKVLYLPGVIIFLVGCVLGVFKLMKRAAIWLRAR